MENCKTPSYEFLRFLQEENYIIENLENSVIINETPKSYYRNSDYKKLFENIELDSNLLLKIWQHENIGTINIKLDAQILKNKVGYKICIKFDENNYEIIKTLEEINRFYEEMCDRYKKFKFCSAIHIKNTFTEKLKIEITKSELREIELFLEEILNDIDLYCYPVYEFFKIDSLKKIYSTMKIIRNNESIDNENNKEIIEKLRNFRLNSKIVECTIDLNHEKATIQMIFFYKYNKNIGF